jgi:hypothetical protein
MDNSKTLNKTGMAQRLARGAHNSEVTGSKPVAGILVHIEFIALYGQLQDNDDIEDKSTGMAQGQRAGLITPRSQDRNLLPVY